MNISVIGGGWSGLVVARMLVDRGHEVMIFQDEPVLGGMLGRGEYLGVPIDAGPHVFHSNDQAVWDWVGQFVNDWHWIMDYPCRVVTRDGDEVPYPISMESADIFKFDPVHIGHEPRTMRDYVLTRYGEETCRLIYDLYTRRLWGVDPSRLVPWPSHHGGQAFKIEPIPETSVYLSERRKAYPVGGWRQVVRNLWPWEWEHAHIARSILDRDDLIIDTSPLLASVGGAWRPTSYGIFEDDAPEWTVRYYGCEVPHIRDFHQSTMTGWGDGADGRAVYMRQYPEGKVAAHGDDFQIVTEHAYPMTGFDAFIEDTWRKLPENVWPFGRGGLHVYDHMAEVVVAAIILVDWIEQGVERTPDRLTHLRGILGGWA